jgi:hypothetical protein
MLNTHRSKGRLKQHPLSDTKILFDCCFFVNCNFLRVVEDLYDQNFFLYQQEDEEYVDLTKD